MMNYARDPILGRGLVFDFAINDTMPDLLASALATAYIYDRGPNRIAAVCTSFIAGTWLIQTPGIVPMMTIDLDGTADCVDCGTGTHFDFVDNGATGVTFEVVVRPDVVGEDVIMGGFVTNAAGEAAYPQLFIDGSGFAVFRPTQKDDNAETATVTGDAALHGGTVHHIVASFEESDNVAEILVDGGTIDKATQLLACTNMTMVNLVANTFYLGCRENTVTGTENFFNGQIYWARMWDRRLTADERLYLYHRAKTVLNI